MHKLDKLEQIEEAANELKKLLDALDELEQQRKELTQQVNRLSGEVIPDLMMDTGVAELKLESGERITVSQDVRARVINPYALKTLLDKEGAGDLIKDTVSVVSAPEALVSQLIEQGLDVKRELKIHPSTLKKLVKESAEKGNFYPDDVIKCYWFNRTKIK